MSSAPTIVRHSSVIEHVGSSILTKKDCRNGVLTTTTLSPTDQRYSKLVMGANTTSFHRRRNKGELLLPTAFSSLTIQSELMPVSGSNCDTKGYGYSFSGPPGRVPGVPLGAYNPWLDRAEMDRFTPSQNDLDYALTAAMSKFEGDFMTLVFFAELHKATDMVTTIIPRIVEALRRSRRFDGKKAAGWWLETEFGWKNIYYDAKALWDMLNKPKRPMRETRTVDIPATPSEPTSREATIALGTSSSLGLSGTSAYRVTQTDAVVASVRGWVAVDHKSAPKRDTLNPFTSAWELIPYSWVIDYVLGVGNWLAAMGTVLGSSAMVSSVSYSIVVERLTVWDPIPPYSTTTVSNTLRYQAQSVGHLLVRVPFSSTPVLAYRTWSIDQLRNVLALLRRRS